MTSARDHADTTAEHHDQAGLQPAGGLPPITPETARRLAAILAPHLMAMRAVIAGTRYADSGDNASDDALSRPAPPVSPATTIFIAGMLQRIPA